MTDLDERPAIEPLPTGGDERWGLLVAGGSLVALGWGLLVLLNVVLHRIASHGGLPFLTFRIYPGFGPFAWASVLIGAGTGLLGVALVYLGSQDARGPFVLPGEPY